MLASPHQSLFRLTLCLRAALSCLFFCLFLPVCFFAFARVVLRLWFEFVLTVDLLPLVGTLAANLTRILPRTSLGAPVRKAASCGVAVQLF